MFEKTAENAASDGFGPNFACVNNWWPSCCFMSRSATAVVRSFVTKRGSRISRERFDLESPVGSTTAPDMTSLAASGWQLS